MSLKPESARSGSAAPAHYDIAVVGAGIVGAAFALAAARQGLNIAVIEARPFEIAKESAGSWDQRIFALSPASLDFLNELGVRARLNTERICSVYGMEIFGDAAQDGDGERMRGSHDFAKLEFSAYTACLPELAQIIEQRQLQNTLWDMLAVAPGITVVVGKPDALTRDSGEATLHLVNGVALHTDLIVAADGAQSSLRAMAGFDIDIAPYNQSGLVANFKTSVPHRNIARQWFRDDGVLAYLPLPGNHISIVWSTPTANATALQAMTAEKLADTVASAGAYVCGALELIGAPALYPLNLLQSRQLIGSRIALIGDAAHVIHPLAGQGLNLGLQDAQALSAALAERGPRNCGDAAVLRGYERRRREAILSMKVATDGLQKLFNRPEKWVGWLRNRGLGLLNSLPAVKKRLIRHAAGC